MLFTYFTSGEPVHDHQGHGAVHHVPHQAQPATRKRPGENKNILQISSSAIHIFQYLGSFGDT